MTLSSLYNCRIWSFKVSSPENCLQKVGILESLVSLVTKATQKSIFQRRYLCTDGSSAPISMAPTWKSSIVVLVIYIFIYLVIKMLCMYVYNYRTSDMDVLASKKLFWLLK